MDLKMGDKVDDFIVCDTKKVNGKSYALLLNTKDDFEGFFEYEREKDGYFTFKMVEDKRLFDKLLIEFADFDSMLKGDYNEE